mgnify:CR=1 FL=1
MAKGGTKRKAVAPAPVTAAARREEFQAERLTGKRAQSGKLPGGGPRYLYEVVWKDGPKGEKYKNSFEPADNLIEWAAEMKAVDEQIMEATNQAFLRPLLVANAAKEKAAKEKADKLTARRESLLRKQRRQQRRQRQREARGEDASSGGSEQEESESEAEDLPDDAAVLTEELLTNLEELRKLGAAPAETTTQTCLEPTTAAEATAPPSTQKKQRRGHSRVWLAFDLATNRCKLPHPQDASRICGALPGQGTGTSAHRRHLAEKHSEEWTHILKTGEVKTTASMISAAFAAKQDVSLPALATKDRDELHRLAALWISKCGRPQAIVEDPELRSLLARILELCKARLRYTLPCSETVGDHLAILGAEGKAIGRDLIVRLLKSGVKPSISGDLWSESGMGLFGIYAHGITETWVMEKALIGLVACASDRHTAENIKKWTAEALVGISLKHDELLQIEG